MYVFGCMCSANGTTLNLMRESKAAQRADGLLPPYRPP